MKDFTPTVWELTQRLISHESRTGQDSESGIGPALHAVNRLRAPLLKLIGVEGYQSLLMRALAMAKTTTPSLSSVRIDVDVTIQWTQDPSLHQSAEEIANGQAALLEELIGLLVVFIGESLTLQLLRTVWPDATLDDMSTEHKETLR